MNAANNKQEKQDSTVTFTLVSSLSKEVFSYTCELSASWRKGPKIKKKVLAGILSPAPGTSGSFFHSKSRCRCHWSMCRWHTAQSTCQTLRHTAQLNESQNPQAREHYVRLPNAKICLVKTCHLWLCEERTRLSEVGTGAVEGRIGEGAECDGVEGGSTRDWVRS